MYLHALLIEVAQGIELSTYDIKKTNQIKKLNKITFKHR